MSNNLQTLREMGAVSNWVPSQDFTEAAKREFFVRADPFLIAHALAHGHTVATHEVHVEGERRKVKIPTVCKGLNVPCVRTFAKLRQRGAVFVLA